MNLLMVGTLRAGALKSSYVMNSPMTIFAAWIITEFQVGNLHMQLLTIFDQFSFSKTRLPSQMGLYVVVGERMVQVQQNGPANVKAL